MKKQKFIPFNANEGESNFTEFSVTHKADRHTKTVRMILILLYILFCVAYIVGFTVLTKLVPLIAILPLLFWILWHFTWKPTCFDYTYIVSSAMLHIYKKDGLKNVTELGTYKISEAKEIAPASNYNGNGKKLYYCSSADCPDLYFGIWSEGDSETAVFFDASAKLLTALKYYAGNKVTLTQVSR